MKPDRSRRSSAGFTLTELLTVIAIIGVLAAILIPTVGSVRTSANKAKTRAQFSQWAAAIESFRSEYGYYPAFHTTALVNGGATSTDHPFHDLLAGRKRDGSVLTAGSSAATQNKKSISFYSFPESDFTDASSSTPNLLHDASDNTAIAVLVDRNLDGVITIGATGDYSTLPTVAGLQPTSGATTADFPSSGIRAGVVFYAPAPEATTSAPSFIFSWK